MEGSKILQNIRDELSAPASMIGPRTSMSNLSNSVSDLCEGKMGGYKVGGVGEVDFDCAPTPPSFT